MDNLIQVVYNKITDYLRLVVYTSLNLGFDVLLFSLKYRVLFSWNVEKPSCQIWKLMEAVFNVNSLFRKLFFDFLSQQ